MNKYLEIIPKGEAKDIPSPYEFRGMTAKEAQEKLIEQFEGKPYVTYALARLIVPIRRWPEYCDADYTYYDYERDCQEFISLLNEYIDTVVDAYKVIPTEGTSKGLLQYYQQFAKTGMRWVASYLDTLVDIHPNISIRNQAMIVMLITKFMPPYLFCSAKEQDKKHCPSCQNGHEVFIGDTWENMKNRIEKQLEITWDQENDPKNIVGRLYNVATTIVDDYHNLHD